jgi:hypothetical protein
MSHTGLSASTITTYISGSQRDKESAILFEIPEICKALIIILYCKVDKTRCLTRDITLTGFEDLAVESFQSFPKLYNLQDTWPAPLYDLLFYIAYMSHTGLLASTITTYISGISAMHKLNGHTDNVISPTRRGPKKHKLNALANIVDSYTDVQTKGSD